MKEQIRKKLYCPFNEIPKFLKELILTTQITYSKLTLMRMSHVHASLPVLIPPAGLNPTTNPVRSW